MKRIHVFAGCRPAVRHAVAHHPSSLTRFRAHPSAVSVPTAAGGGRPGRRLHVPATSVWTMMRPSLAAFVRAVKNASTEYMGELGRAWAPTTPSSAGHVNNQATTQSAQSQWRLPACKGPQHTTRAVDGFGVDAACVALRHFHKRLKLGSQDPPRVQSLDAGVGLEAQISHSGLSSRRRPHAPAVQDGSFPGTRTRQNS